MTDLASYGLSKRQLEYELRWLMNQAPTDPAKLAEFLGKCVITLIDKNNAALARSAADAARPDLPERR
ncbi:hypothetical protein [Micromonospora sp. CB01531]|uniref:hypothetical protein n=1 Tax=Micromonospora sp. CB01531 TaxID=1718947 RepID=UPI00093D2ABE|nr:hypothetical protein [Micromonospora sp. CB01531]OKI51392.1 hypothetical protein A6A27_33500 [Micromonospora sp. CB01531]